MRSAIYNYIGNYMDNFLNCPFIRLLKTTFMFFFLSLLFIIYVITVCLFLILIHLLYEVKTAAMDMHLVVIVWVVLVFPNWIHLCQNDRMCSFVGRLEYVSSNLWKNKNKLAGILSILRPIRSMVLCRQVNGYSTQ